MPADWVVIMNNTSILHLSVYQIKQYAECNNLKIQTEHTVYGMCYVWFYSFDGGILVSAGADSTLVRAYQNAFATLKDKLWQYCQSSWLLK